MSFLSHLTIPFQISLQTGRKDCEEKTNWYSAWLVDEKHWSTAEDHFHICSGSIIWDIFILTSAHCLYTSGNLGSEVVQPEKLSVLAGTTNLDDNSEYQRYCVERVIVHEEYIFNDTKTTPFDIALLKIARPLDFSDSKKIGLIAFSSEYMGAGALLSISG